MNQISWLRNISKALGSGSEDFAIWVAVHWQHLGDGSNLHRVLSVVCDLRDWVRACVIQNIDADDVNRICKVMDDHEVVSELQKWWQDVSDLAEAGGPFNDKMSPQTVIKLSGEWHERQAETAAADVEFPQEWFEGGTVGNIRIEPIKTAVELSRYAYLFHNCATSYAHRIADENCFLYVVFEGEDVKAMLEIESDEAGVRMGDLKGPRNNEVSGELRAAADTWWDERKCPAKSQPVEAAAVP